MADLNRDITNGVLLIAGVWGFISGQFIMSAVLFAGAAVVSHIRTKSVPDNG